MSSLSDYIKLMKTLLDPSRSESLLPPHVIREWLRPLHGWSDDTTEVGMLWEIEKIRDTYGRHLRIYQKLGALEASRSVFALHPENGIGVALLTIGSSGVAPSIALDIFKRLQPPIDHLLVEDAISLYSGVWRDAFAEDGDSEVVLAVDDGSLWATKVLLNGTDVLGMTQGLFAEPTKLVASPVNLWATGRQHEFRISFADVKDCFGGWATIDSGFAKGYPLDLIYFTESQDRVDGADRGRSLIMHIPSVGVQLSKIIH